MAHATLTPVFVGLRVGLHVLLVGLAAFAVVPGFVTERSSAPGALLIAILFVAVYAGGVLLPRKRVPATLWVAALTLLWAVLVWLAPEGAYLVFPLFFLYLHVLPGAGGIIAVIASTAIAILALGLHLGFSVGGVIGPLVGAGAAILIGLGYRALAREAAERQELVDELLRTRERLAATEREQGALAERSRLAREIHDTVAQGLSSIQMLLHAAERDDPDGPGARHVRLARETAADSLAETRRFIRELAPPSLDDGFAAALRRLAEDQSRRSGLVISVETPDELHLPMSTQTALLRIAQGAVSNVVRHAAAGRARILVEAIDGRVTLSVHDDGVGFDPEHVAAGGGSADSFGLRAIAERARQLGGTLVVESEPGRGTLLSVTLERGDA
ncbi:two-component sensor histidine kinase [Leucobacter sp. OLJS4]|uniref:sensor histidine kinase n=1 Tax=unclassified Leucobacter TaxID=2621730 RepID=UPI000C177D31|nr:MULTISPECIES: sensor histidine kinase [unclassified Leucobacter]PIJ41973.1 two-component sensor histidine kinase [Leucobacter sp. OLES1]PII84417.1 two-component sensor histidine kinase [Leucobacter sp. OLCALW19]PII90987.1 two-component sensor histidine kinase [Leucobacter sp. OLAS13]PII95614.1 two-component sensor histidine kinase [Leucobacter sp. OLTLW20]PII97734.1 two-component sensor histidine kinase [Leucobacter sp. OLDS2]